MNLSDFDFELPDNLIATRPAVPRTSSRLLVATADTLTDTKFSDITSWLRSGDRLVLNDTKVIPARLTGQRFRTSPEGTTSAKIEVTLLEPQEAGRWTALVKPLKKLREGEHITFAEGFSAELVEKRDGQALLHFNASGDAFETALAASGAMPLPPYIAAKRPADAQDMTDYQTVFARHSGAVAAPTASLHFDQDLLELLQSMGVEISYVTLHVGAGTFLPVKVDDITTHKMHSEWGQVPRAAAEAIIATKSAGHRVIPVGTTALRLIESAAHDGQISAWEGDTEIFIYPGYDFRVADALITNFHLPCSTLMMLVSALMGKDRVDDIYRHAIENEYRFFSYGDASLLLP
jgi:S-adenosylmethionine:tRNA ribosyltransferase-isomerase